VGSGRLAAERRRLQAAYFGTRVVGPDQYDAVVQFLSIFAQHLGELSSQYLRRASAGEAPAVAKARAFILERQGEPLTLAQVAHAVNMSTFYFCKIFKKATGLTFTAYLAQVRIDTVKNLLRDPAKRVSEAAYEAGFQSLSQFNRVFHERVGESPSHYRDSLPAAAPAPAHPGEWRLAAAV
jgi:AraC-like DNA-binding protein